MPAPVKPDDLYDIESSFGDDERLIRKTVADFVRDHVDPIIGQCFEDGVFPRELIPALAGLGLFGMHLEGYGCAGSSATAYGVAAQELEACDAGLRSFVSVQGSLAMFPIWSYGSEEQKQRWLPEMAAGRVIGCFALTEPDSGSDPGAMQTTARRQGGDWVLNGNKMWITNGSIADVAVVWAKADGEIRGFLVEKGTPGFETSDIKRKLSLRASITSELSFSDVRVPNENVLPGVAGLRGPLSCLNEARFGISWGVLGSARTCLLTALAYTKSRRAFGKNIASFQLTQEKLATMATQLLQAQLLAKRLGELKDQSKATPVHISIAKRANVRMALDVSRMARTLLGANGITLEYPITRHMANLETVLTYEGTEEIHTLILGKALTGEDALA